MPTLTVRLFDANKRTEIPDIDLKLRGITHINVYERVEECLSNLYLNPARSLREEIQSRTIQQLQGGQNCILNIAVIPKPQRSEKTGPLSKDISVNVDYKFKREVIKILREKGVFKGYHESIADVRMALESVFKRLEYSESTLNETRETLGLDQKTDTTTPSEVVKTLKIELEQLKKKAKRDSQKIQDHEATIDRLEGQLKVTRDELNRVQINASNTSKCDTGGSSYSPHKDVRVERKDGHL